MAYQNKLIKYLNNEINLSIWEVPLEKQFKSMRINCYKKCNGILILIDLADESSILNLKDWILEAQQYSKGISKIFIIGINEEESIINKKNFVGFVEEHNCLAFQIQNYDIKSIKKIFSNIFAVLVKNITIFSIEENYFERTQTYFTNQNRLTSKSEFEVCKKKNSICKFLFCC